LGMLYSSNVSDKNKGDGLLLECLTQKEGLWYTPRMSQTKTTSMIYSSKRSISYPLFLSETFEEYTITLVSVWDIRGVYHNQFFSFRHSRSISYHLCLSEPF
jgi:hypothetical protein